jgi:hypothetical protein
VRQLVVVAVLAVLALLPAVIARRKGRSFWWWWLGGLIVWLPAICLAAVIPRPGHPYRFSAPRALLFLASVLLGLFVTLGVVSEVF